MAQARVIIRNALTFGLNRLSPGEQEDADLFGRCLDALNDVVDEFNGVKSMLFREILTPSAAPISGVSGTLGTTWTGLVAGDEILGATVQYGGLDIALAPMTMAVYADVAIKTLSTIPAYYAHDGQATVYIYPAPNAYTITLRTKQAFTEFADLDTDYTMPKGFRAALSDLLAEKMADVLTGGISPKVARAARGARLRLMAQCANPAIIRGGDSAGPVARIRRGY